MPDSADSEDRPSCLPERNSEVHLPKIKRTISPRGIRQDDNRRPLFTTKSYNFSSHGSSKKFNPDNCDVKEVCNETFIHGNNSNSPRRAPKSGALFKLPVIDMYKNYTVCQASENSRHQHTVQRDRSRERLPKVSQSHYYFSNFDSRTSLQAEDDEALSHINVVSTKINQTTTQDPMHKGDSHIVKLPNISQSSIVSSNLIRSSFIASSNGNVSHNSSLILFNHENSSTNLSMKDLSPVVRKSKFSQKCVSESRQRSGTHISALLLPISVELNARYRDKRRRKREENKALQITDDRDPGCLPDRHA